MTHSVAPRVFLEREGEMRICIFCGSSRGNNELYADAAREMGRTLAQRRIDLVYGGGRVGLMGELAEGALITNGTVIGVMPQSLVQREIQHTNLSKLHIVATMHERKTKMAELADGFIALPGGAGTFEEIFEQWTWAQLGIHQKPCGFLNTNGYFDPLRKMIAQKVDQGFLRPDCGASVEAVARRLRMSLTSSIDRSIVPRFSDHLEVSVEGFGHVCQEFTLELNHVLRPVDKAKVNVKRIQNHANVGGTNEILREQDQAHERSRQPLLK